MSALKERLHPRQVFAMATSAYLKSFVLSGALLLLLTLVTALATMAMLSLMPELARLQLPLVLDSSGVGVSSFGFSLLLAEVAIPGGILALLVLGVSYVALVRLLHSALSDAPLRFGASFVHGLRYCFFAAVTFFSIVAMVALLAVITPLLMVLGAVGLLVGLVAKLAKRQLRIRARWFLAALIPGGLAAAMAWRGSLAVPLVALEGHGPFAAMRRSVRLTKSAPLSAPLSVVIAFGAYFALQALVGLIGPAGAPTLVVTFISLFAQVLTFAFPMAVLVVITRVLRDAEYPIIALPALRRPLRVTSMAGVVTIALVLGLASPVTPATVAFAEDTGTSTSETPLEEPEATESPAPVETAEAPVETPAEIPDETPPPDESGEVPNPGDGTTTPDTDFIFRPVLSVLEGELTAPGDEITLLVKTSTDDGGQVPYTFYFDAYLLGPNDERTLLNTRGSIQAAGGGREAGYSLYFDGTPELGVGQHRFLVETRYVPVRGGTALAGPTLEHTHLVGEIDASTRVVLSATPTSLTADESVELVAAVEGDLGPAPAGNVTFQRVGDTTDSAITVGVDSTGTARAVFSGLTVGSHSFEATYRYAAAGIIATATAVQVTVVPYPASLALEAPAEASMYGRSAVFPFTLLAPKVGLAPSGSVELRSNGAVLDRLTLNASDFADGKYQGALTASALPLGLHEITASFTSDNGQHQPANSAPVTHRVTPIPVALEITSRDGLSLPLGSYPEFTVSIGLPEGSTPLPSGGTLELQIGDETRSIPLSEGQSIALFRIDDLDAAVEITASLSGYSTHVAASTMVRVTTRAAHTQAQVALSVPALPGAAQGFIAWTSGETNRHPVDGRIEVRAKGTSTWKTLQLDANNLVTFTIPLGLGEHTIEARYVSARPNEFINSDISESDFVISHTLTTLTATAPAASLRVGESYQVTVRAENSNLYPALPGPEGQITAARNGQIVARATLTNRTATLDLPASVAGEDLLQFSFDGSETHGSSSVSLAVPIALWASNVTLQQTPEVALVGEAITLTAVVSSAAPAQLAPVAGGTVEFTRGGQQIGTATLAANGTATLTTTARITVGTDTIRAHYLGTAGVIEASDATVQQTVAVAPTNIEFTVNPDSAHSRDQVDITVRVSTDPRSPIQATSGSVTLSGSLTGTIQSEQLGSDGTATFTVIAPLTDGQVYDFTLGYSGTSQLAAASTRGDIRVDAASVALTIDSAEQIVAGDSSTVTVQLATQGATPIPSNGAVDLYAGAALIGSKNLGAGTGNRISFTVTTPNPLTIGEHQLTARFRGAFGYQLSASEARTVTVVGRETEVQLTVSPRGSVPRGTPVSATATVNVVWSDTPAYGQVWLRSVATDEVIGQKNLSWSHDDRTSATFALDDLPIGEHEFYAEFLPSGNLNAGSRSSAVDLEVTGRPVSLMPFYGEIRVGQNKTVPVNVSDANALHGSPPGGSVDILLGDKLVGTAVTTELVDALTARAFVTIPLQQLVGGDQRFTVRFRSTDDIHSFAERTDTMPVSRLTPQIAITPVGDLSRLQWGDDFYVNVSANRSAEAGAETLPPPSGALTVRLATGAVCVPATGQQYRCTPNSPGIVTITAEVAGDANYVRGERRFEVGPAGKRTPTLVVDLQPSSVEVETGTPQRLTWRLDGPDVRPTLTGLPISAVCAGTTSGNCEFSFGLQHAGSAQELKVEFSGTALWEPADWQQSITPVGCYPLTLRAEPQGSGTVTVAAIDGAKCSADGYRAGTRVGIKATPTDSATAGWAYQLSSIGGRAPSTEVGGLHWFTVGTGAGEFAEVVALFNSEAVCYPVTLQENGYSSTSWGSLQLNQQPNCPGRILWQSGSSAQQPGQRTSTSVGWYQVGTVLTPSAAPFSNGEFYSARIVDDGPGVVASAAWSQTMPGAFTVDRAVRVQARFGAPCLPVTLAAEGPGRVERQTSPNCQDEFRPDQFQLDTEVNWIATPDESRYAYVDSVFEAQRLPVPARIAAERTGLESLATRAAPGGNVASLRFAQCHTLTLTNLSPELASVDASPSNCPVGQNPDAASATWRYSHATKVALRANLLGQFYTQPTFSGWKFPGASASPSIAALNLRPYLNFNITEDLALRPSYVLAGGCAPVSVSSGDPLVEVMVSPESKALERCPEGGLLAGWTGGTLKGDISADALVAQARSTEGNPKLGWVLGGTGADPTSPSAGVGTPGATVSFTGGGGRTLTAFACQEVGSYIGLTDINGDVGIAKQRDGTFIEVSPAPNCPFSNTAWLVGTELSFSASADERGYVFHGWGGPAVANSADPRSASYTVTNVAPAVAVTALYEVVCYTLTLTGRAHRVTSLPAPNCPGAAPGAEFTGQYIGGTPVALIGEVPGGNIWQGWRGDVVETGKVKVAVVIMDADKSAEHRYRAKDWDEKAVDFFEDMGDALAVAAKKSLGAVAYVAGKAIQDVPPFSYLGEAFEVLSLMGEVLNFIGVPTSVTKYFSYPAQSLDWVVSGFTCLASASLSSQNGGASANLSGVADSNQRSINSAGGSFFKAIGIDPGDDNELVGETLEKLYVTGKVVGYATKYTGVGGGVSKTMDTIDIGLELYGLATGPQGVGWDSSASDAWDSDMGNHITGCMAAATPDFIRGALPINDKEFDRLEDEYGL